MLQGQIKSLVQGIFQNGPFFFFFLLEQLWDISMYKIILFSSYFGKEKFLI